MNERNYTAILQKKRTLGLQAWINHRLTNYRCEYDEVNEWCNNQTLTHFTNQIISY